MFHKNQNVLKHRKLILILLYVTMNYYYYIYLMKRCKSITLSNSFCTQYSKATLSTVIKISGKINTKKY